MRHCILLALNIKPSAGRLPSRKRIIGKEGGDLNEDRFRSRTDGHCFRSCRCTKADRVHYWEPIAERYGLNLKVVNAVVDPTFRFMTLDWDGRIRMDPSSQYAMQSLVAMKDSFDIAFACDTDHDRHGIVTKSVGLLPPNHYLSVCIHYLFSNRPQWGNDAAVGKTVVSSSMIDRVAARLGRKLYEVPVGFKYFVDGLLHCALGFAGEESAEASFLG